MRCLKNSCESQFKPLEVGQRRVASPSTAQKSLQKTTRFR